MMHAFTHSPPPCAPNHPPLCRLAPEGEAPCPRGWLAAAANPSGILISGGNSNSNERLGDLWLLDMHS